MNIRPALPLEVAVGPLTCVGLPEVGLAEGDLIVARERVVVGLRFKPSPFVLETEGRG